VLVVKLGELGLQRRERQARVDELDLDAGQLGLAAHELLPLG